MCFLTLFDLHMKKYAQLKQFPQNEGKTQIKSTLNTITNVILRDILFAFVLDQNES